MAKKLLNFQVPAALVRAINPANPNAGGVFPTLPASYKGAAGFDTSINRIRYWDGTDWVNYGLNGDAGNGNVSIGNLIFEKLRNGLNNTAIGNNVLNNLYDTSANTAVGSKSMSNGLNCEENTAVGFETLNAAVSTIGNTAIGYRALKMLAYNHNNVAVGKNALTALTNGQGNVAIGVRALEVATGVNSMVAVGMSALANNTTGGSNTAVGAAALTMNSTGSNNVAVGGSCLEGNSTGNNNVALGLSALKSNTSGSSSIAIGCNSLQMSSISNNNIAIGTMSIYGATGNQTFDNVAIGASTLEAANNGVGSNIAIGHSSLKALNNTASTAESPISSSFSNTFVGNMSGNRMLAGQYNTAQGSLALERLVEGKNNTAVGYQALGLAVNRNGLQCNFNSAFGSHALLSASGKYNDALGSNSASATGFTGSNNLALGSDTMLNITSGSGNIQIGGRTATSGAYSASPCFNLTNQNNMIVLGSTSVTNAYVQVAWTVVSDARDKTNFAAIPHGLTFVKQLKPIAYQFKVSRDSEETNGGVRYGFKAQDIAAIEPEGVIVDTTNPEKLYYNEGNMIPVLVKAIQELTIEVERLKAKVE